MQGGRIIFAFQPVHLGAQRVQFSLWGLRIFHWLVSGVTKFHNAGIVCFSSLLQMGENPAFVMVENPTEQKRTSMKE